MAHILLMLCCAHFPPTHRAGLVWLPCSRPARTGSSRDGARAGSRIGRTSRRQKSLSAVSWCRVYWRRWRAPCLPAARRPRSPSAVACRWCPSTLAITLRMHRCFRRRCCCRRRLLPRIRERHAARKHRQVAREAPVCVAYEALPRRGRVQRVLGRGGRAYLCKEAVPAQALLLVVGIVSCKRGLR